jgi:Flp pilus assembly protein TadG
MILVAVAMVAIIAMAALSIDVVTLYLAREEAQRAADAAALASAKVISLSGVTSDPNNSSSEWASICGGSTSPATQTATSVAKQSTVGSAAATTVTVDYSAGGVAPTSDCSALPFSTGVNNPMVTVKVVRGSLPTFFSRMWGRTGNSVSATATAEVFNPSNSANVGNGATGTITAVQPRCVKPWIIPNIDPLNPNDSCSDSTTCNKFVDPLSGQVMHSGTTLNGGGSAASGVIGETFWIEPDCHHTGGTCRLRNGSPMPNWYSPSNPGIRAYLQPPPSLEYLPGEAPIATPVALPSCASGNPYEEAIGGCDQSTYHCGVQHSSLGSPNRVDLSENPSSGTNDTLDGVKCLIHESNENTYPSGQDTMDLTSYPFKILSGTSNPILGSNVAISNSPSIVSLPIYDSNADVISGTGISPVTIIGFLQVFINQVDPWGNVQVTVLNVAGCSNGTGTDPVGSAVAGSSPVPVRLITTP